MRVRLLLVPAVVVAIVYSCAGSDHFTGTGTGTGIGGQTGDASVPPDAGTDAGFDAGTDAGCNTQALPLGTVFAKDSCVSPGTVTNTTAAIVSAGCANVTISMGDGFNCNGTLSTPANAFDGTCNTLPCTSPKMPGTITCTQVNLATCTVQVCADTTGVNCP